MAIDGLIVSMVLNSLGVLPLVKRQLILWISLRCLARWTLPVAEGSGRYHCIIVGFSSQMLSKLQRFGATAEPN